MRGSRRKPLTWKAKPSSLRPGDTSDDAIALILDNCLAQIVANHAAAEERRGTAGVHQMRVGLRRLRAALKVLHKKVPAVGFTTFSNAAEKVADAMGPVRNLDALAERLAESDLRRRMPATDRRALRVAIKRRRVVLFDEMQDALRSAETRCFLDDLAAWIAARAWRNEIAEEKLPLLAAPVEHLAKDILNGLAHKAEQRGRGFKGQLPVQRHKFRIAIKKLRYAAKFFAPLYDKPDRYLSPLGKLQNALGEDHDAVVIPTLLKELGHDSQSDALHHAARALKDALAKRQPALRAELRKRRHQWKKTKAFW